MSPPPPPNSHIQTAIKLLCSCEFSLLCAHIHTLHKLLAKNIFELLVSYDHNPSIAATDLFPFTNQFPHQAIRPHTDQSEAERIDSPFLSWTIFFSLFGSNDKSESNQLIAKTDLSRVLCFGHSTWKTFTEGHAATSFTHRRTNLAASHTSYLLQCHTSNKLKDQHTIRRHQKEPFLTLALLLLL